MTSKIVVNNIEADAGVSTVTFNSNIVRGGSNLHSTGLALGAGSTIGAVTGVTTYYGDGSQLTGIDSTKIETGNTKVETIDTGSDGHIKVTTEGTERLRIKNDGKVNITPGGTLSGSHPPGDLNIVGTNFLTMTPNDNANPSDNEVLGQVSFLPYGAGSIGAASAKIEAVAESGQSGSANPTSLRFYTKPSSAGPGNSGTERMRINPDGYLTQPNRPAFSTAEQTSGFSANSLNYLTPSAIVNNGNHYNASNGRFTAPIAGTYFFFFSYVGDNGVASPVMYFHKNGTSTGPGQSCYYTAYQGTYHGILLTLSANDYVNASARDWNGTTPDPWSTYWGGWLLY